MKAADRRRAMLLEVIMARDANVEELSASLNVSVATIRRDLTFLARERRIIRTYGGATSLVGVSEPETSLEERKAQRREEKEQIGRLAAKQIGDGETIFLDGGTTTSALAHHLGARYNLHVVTNNLLAVPVLTNFPEVKVTLIGGDVRTSSMSTLGPLAQLLLSRVSVNKVFLGADGVVASVGLCEATAEQAYLKECMIRQAAEVFVLADKDKLGRGSQQHWTPLECDWTLITDSGAEEARLAPFRSLKQVKVLVA